MSVLTELDRQRKQGQKPPLVTVSNTSKLSNDASINSLLSLTFSTIGVNQSTALLESEKVTDFLVLLRLTVCRF